MKRQRYEGDVVHGSADRQGITPTEAEGATIAREASNNHNVVAGVTTSPPLPPPVRDHIQWSSYIKAHHQRIRDAMKTRYGGDAQAAWNAMKQDDAALQQYATAMHHLATQYWDVAPSDGARDAAGEVNGEGGVATDGTSPSSPTASPPSASTAVKFRYDDRVQYAVQCVQEYFIGPVAGNGVSSLPTDAAGTYLPMAVTMSLKLEKRRFYAEHRCPMPDEAQRQWVLEWLTRHRYLAIQGNPTAATTSLDVVWSAYCDMYEQPSTTTTTLLPPRKLCFLDVGSCYAPFEGKALTYFTPPEGNQVDRHRSGDDTSCPSTVVAPSWTATRWDKHPLPMDVVSVDLAPYDGSSVLACDWLDVGVCAPRPGATKMTAAKDALILDGVQRPRVVAIVANAFDVVTFSLVLSYMPTPQMRYDACRRAHAVLRDYGLLVVVSTRTQGPRQASWINDWVSAIESIGFVRVHKNMHCRLVGLTFQKTAAGDQQRQATTEPAALPPLDAKAAALAAKMVITADTL